MKSIFYLIVSLIAYGSFYPFDFNLDAESPERLSDLFDFNILSTSLSNIVANIVLFIPFGIFIRAAYPHCRSKRCLLVFLAIGFSYSFLIQALQIWTLSGIPWGGNSIWNVVGCGLGFLFFTLFRSERYKHVQSLSPKQGLSLFILIALFSLLASNSIWQKKSAPISIAQVSWAGSNAPEMIFDHHTHTQYSDGSLSVEELVEMSFFKGCDAIAITDHNSYDSLPLVKFEEIAQMRQAYPGLLIFSGIELGMPSSQGREHVNIITTPRFERELLTTILKRQSESLALAQDERDLFALALIDTVPLAREHTITIYNHPSRKDDKPQENTKDIKSWNQNKPNINAFSGAPGHQKHQNLGAYEHIIKHIERWDPVVAQVGGTWDTLLSEGHRIWGAIASSDYHNETSAFPPCEFSRIHVKTPASTYEGLIDGIQAGTFWADHGKLLQQYDFYLQANHKSPPVFAGGEIMLHTAEPIVTVNVDLKRGSNHAQDFLRFDIISNCATEQASFSSHYIPPEEHSASILLALSPDGKNCFVRSRVVKETIDGLNLSAYSNPIFISF
jgi:predicted metal-dependent phosphoesterase TrpH/glycopeptide antibiotics resistance protein